MAPRTEEGEENNEVGCHQDYWVIQDTQTKEWINKTGTSIEWDTIANKYLDMEETTRKYKINKITRNDMGNITLFILRVRPGNKGLLIVAIMMTPNGQIAIKAAANPKDEPSPEHDEESHFLWDKKQFCWIAENAHEELTLLAKTDATAKKIRNLPSIVTHFEMTEVHLAFMNKVSHYFDPENVCPRNLMEKHDASKGTVIESVGYAERFVIEMEMSARLYTDWALKHHLECNNHHLGQFKETTNLGRYHNMEVPPAILRESVLDGLAREFEKHPGTTIRSALERSINFLSKTQGKEAFRKLKIEEYVKLLEGDTKLNAELDDIFDDLPFPEDGTNEYREMKTAHIYMNNQTELFFDLGGLRDKGPSHKTTLELSWDVEEKSQTCGVALASSKKPRKVIKMFGGDRKPASIPIQRYNVAEPSPNSQGERESAKK